MCVCVRVHAHQKYLGSLCGVMAKVLDCDIIVSGFELQSRYCVHFRTNTLEKGMNSHIPHPTIS